MGCTGIDCRPHDLHAQEHQRPEISIVNNYNKHTNAAITSYCYYGQDVGISTECTECTKSILSRVFERKAAYIMYSVNACGLDLDWIRPNDMNLGES